MTLPALVRPMLATAATELPDGDGWSYEMKWDGVRAVVYLEPGRPPRVLSRNDRDVSVSYPELEGLEGAVGRPAILDGEIVAFDAHGRPSFGALQSRMHVSSAASARRLAASQPVSLLVFDLLHLDDRSLLDTAYDERRMALDGLGLAAPHWTVPPTWKGAGDDVLAASKAQGLEGVVAKRCDSRYLPGRRSEAWLKVKHQLMQEVVVIGWDPGEGRRKGLPGSLLVAVPDDDGRLLYAGKVGTGFTDAMLRDLAHDLGALATDTPPYDGEVPRADVKDAVWVEPRLVGEVRFSEWTRDGRLRHPAWRGLRPDKDASEVRREY